MKKLLVFLLVLTPGLCLADYNSDSLGSTDNDGVNVEVKMNNPNRYYTDTYWQDDNYYSVPDYRYDDNDYYLYREESEMHHHDPR